MKPRTDYLILWSSQGLAKYKIVDSEQAAFDFLGTLEEDGAETCSIIRCDIDGKSLTFNEVSP